MGSQLSHKWASLLSSFPGLRVWTSPLDRGIGDAIVLFATGAAIVSAPAYARLLGLDASTRSPSTSDRS